MRKLLLITAPLIVAILITADLHAATKKKAATCPVVGIKSITQYLTKTERACFNTTAKAESKGYTAYTGCADASDPGALGFTGTLSGAQEVPANGSSATGSCSAVLNAAQTSLKVLCTHNASSPVAAHIHEGATGVDGDVICSLSDGTNPISATCAVDSTFLTALLAGNTYVNIHTLANGNGEIRAQLTAG